MPAVQCSAAAAARTNVAQQQGGNRWTQWCPMTPWCNVRLLSPPCIGLTPSANCLNLELTHRTKEAKWIKANIYKMTKCSSQKSVAIMLFSRKERVGWRWKWNGMINCNLYTWPGCDLCFQQHHRLHLVNWMCHLSLVSALKISAGGTCQLASG